MTEEYYTAIQILAIAGGVGVFFGAFGIYEGELKIKNILWSVIILVITLAVSFFLGVNEHYILAFIITVFASGWFTLRFKSVMEERFNTRTRRTTWLLVLSLILLTVIISHNESVKLSREKQLVKEREEAIKLAINQLRNPWRKALFASPGVNEFSVGNFLFWLAIDPVIEIDAEYEDELGEEAWREIPIRFVILNDNFSLETGTEADSTIASWSVLILNDTGEQIHSWEDDLSLRPFQPAERLDYRLVWDGRYDSGKLVPPGDYEVEVYADTSQGSLYEAVSLAIEDSGPIEIVNVDATTSYIRHTEQMIQWNKILQEGLRNLEQFRFQSFSR